MLYSWEPKTQVWSLHVGKQCEPALHHESMAPYSSKWMFRFSWLFVHLDFLYGLAGEKRSVTQGLTCRKKVNLWQLQVRDGNNSPHPKPWGATVILCCQCWIRPMGLTQYKVVSYSYGSEFPVEKWFLVCAFFKNMQQCISQVWILLGMLLEASVVIYYCEWNSTKRRFSYGSKPQKGMQSHMRVLQEATRRPL